MIVSRLGDSLAVKLDKDVVETLGLKEGDEVEVAVRRLRPEPSPYDPNLDPQEWLQRMRRFRGMLPVDFKFDRAEANER